MILAMPAAAPAMPANPSKAATMAMIRNVTVHASISVLPDGVEPAQGKQLSCHTGVHERRPRVEKIAPPTWRIDVRGHECECNFGGDLNVEFWCLAAHLAAVANARIFPTRSTA